MPMKQVILIRSDIKMSKGKLAAQSCHASVSCVLKSDKIRVKKWEMEGQKKVILKCKSLDELIQLKEKCSKLGIINAIISDAGRTELTPGTVTALGIGPEEENRE